MKNPQKILLATRNHGKIKEIKKLFENLIFQFLTPDQITIPQNFKIKETGITFAENAILKAEGFGKLTELITIADDSGLEIDALGGLPGVRSSRFKKGSDSARIKKVLKLLKNVAKSKRKARYKIVIAIYNPETGKTTLFKAKTEGLITTKPTGTGGFGYDPIFYSRKLKKTFAQVSISEKNAVSHRGKALRKAKRFLRKLQSAS